MSTPLVSILIATYNAEAFIRATLESCLHQTYTNREILIFDDGSTDGTLAIVQSYKDQGVALYSSEKKQGPYGALNMLLAHAKGTYVAIQDHDDVWLPQKIERQVDFLESTKKTCCGTESYYFYEQDGILIRNKKAPVTDFVDHTSLMFLNQPTYRYDLAWVLADEHFEKVVLGGSSQGIPCIQEALLVHRIRTDSNNLSSSRLKFRRKDIVQFFQLHKIRLGSVSYLLDSLFGKYIPKRIRWIVRARRMRSTDDQLTKQDFLERYPEVGL